MEITGSLIKCPRCGNLILKSAGECSYCGHIINLDTYKKDIQPNNIEREITREKQEEQGQTGIKTITCPNCNSTKVHKITGLSKAGSAALFGIFSLGKLNKTYQCDNCGYRW